MTPPNDAAVVPDEVALAETANTIRQHVIEMLLAAGSGHSAGSLGMADVFTALYFAVLHIDPADPWKPDRDRVVLSNGHICPVWYATLAQRGFFDVDELTSLRTMGSRLQGHPHVRSLPGIEASSGPLGQGLSQGIGMALAARLDGASWRTHVLLSDGEHDEGQLWSATTNPGRGEPVRSTDQPDAEISINRRSIHDE
ncbi:MAG: hypothetical protein DLM58_15025 [Pseudonocardiales bacterium]|nr:MAG: hypothetical protein DLM58_15025 [Pseudonocardiales bacterium]